MERFDLVEKIATLPHKQLYNAWFDACKAGDIPTMSALIRSGKIDVNAKDTASEALCTGFIWAARNGRLDAVCMLSIVPGIDVNAKTKYGDTALVWAQRNKHEPVEDQLLALPGIDKTNYITVVKSIPSRPQAINDDQAPEVRGALSYQA